MSCFAPCWAQLSVSATPGSSQVGEGSSQAVARGGKSSSPWGAPRKTTLVSAGAKGPLSILQPLPSQCTQPLAGGGVGCLPCTELLLSRSGSQLHHALQLPGLPGRGRPRHDGDRRGREGAEGLPGVLPRLVGPDPGKGKSCHVPLRA